MAACCSTVKGVGGVVWGGEEGGTLPGGDIWVVVLAGGIWEADFTNRD